MEDNLYPKLITKPNGEICEYYELDLSLEANSRKELKDRAINKFLEEKGGYWKDGTKHTTCYKYYVEKTSDGRRIYILRPAYLNKGMDFTVWAEKASNGKDKKPSHEDVGIDLRIKYKENPKQFILLLQAIDKVWNCEEPDNILKDSKLNFKNGFPVELLLKILKWLFIEQDVTYWNYTGRAMLKAGIDKEFSSS